MAEEMDQLLLTWIKNSDGSVGMKWLSSSRCPDCRSMNVRWWNLSQLVRTYQCGDCQSTGVISDGS